MATLTRLASTLTAKYFPSQTLTDAFYIDGRLFGKRETRQADITIDKEERGFFLSVFAHPNMPNYEPGMMPPYEPELRHTCNEVKFGRKEIDAMIEGFLTTAVDVTGKTKLADNNRSPYFSGVIVRDAEAFAVTIGSGLAFLYRDDTLFPLTDAGIPMEPIDVNGNRVADFLYYCSSKTANALWSNFFTLSPDDCIILCNKEIYDALGQREILRILAEADDQCDAAGVIITQASARMPNVPMQFSISFVESVTSDEKRGLFGFKKKSKEADIANMSVTSTLDGGIVGAAAEASANAGFTGGLMMTDAKSDSSYIMFGDTSNGPSAPANNQPASSDKGIEVLFKEQSEETKVEFLDDSAKQEPINEISAEDMMRSLFGKPASIEEETVVETVAPAPVESINEPAIAPVEEVFNPFDTPDEDDLNSDDSDVKSVTEIPFTFPEDNAKTKPVDRIDSDFIASLQSDSQLKKDGIIEAALREMGAAVPEEKEIAFEETTAKTEETKAEEVEETTLEEAFDVDKFFAVPEEIVPETPVVSESGELVFTEAAANTDFGGVVAPDASAEFNPYSVGTSEEMENAAPLVFGDNGFSAAPDFEVESNGSDVPNFELNIEKPVLAEDDKLPVDFPVNKEAKEETLAVAVPAPVTEAPVEAPIEEISLDSLMTDDNLENAFSLPFANSVETIPEEKPAQMIADDVPEMPLYNANTFDTPVAAVNSAEPVNSNPEDVYTYGQYQENESMSDSYEPFDAENNNFANNINEGYQYYQNDSYQPESVPQDTYQNSYYPDAGIDMDQSYQPADSEYQDLSYGGNENNETYADTESGDDWINGILGLDGSNAGYADTTNIGDTTVDTGANYQSYDNQQYYTPANTGANYPQNRQQQRKPAQSASANRGGKKIKLNRNGYIFIAFVVLMLICFVVLISIILKACNKDDGDSETVATSVSETTPVDVENTTPSEPSTPTTPADPVNDALAPQGAFYFSDNIGYKSWWDLFNKVYSIQIESESDPRIKVLLDYNNYYLQTQGQSPIFQDGYKPNAGDMVLLPSIEVISGAVVIPDPSNPNSNAPTGELGVVDGTSESTDDTAVSAEDATASDTEPATSEG